MFESRRENLILVNDTRSTHHYPKHPPPYSMCWIPTMRLSFANKNDFPSRCRYVKTLPISLYIGPQHRRMLYLPLLGTWLTWRGEARLGQNCEIKDFARLDKKNSHWVCIPTLYQFARCFVGPGFSNPNGTCTKIKGAIPSVATASRINTDCTPRPRCWNWEDIQSSTSSNSVKRRK